MTSKQKRKREANQPLGKVSEQRDIREMFAKMKVRNTDAIVIVLSTVVDKYVCLKEVEIKNTLS